MAISRKQDLREKALVLELEKTIHQPLSKYKSGGNYVVTEEGKKIRLSSAGNTPTLAGKSIFLSDPGCQTTDEVSLQPVIDSR